MARCDDAELKNVAALDAQRNQCAKTESSSVLAIELNKKTGTISLMFQPVAGWLLWGTLCTYAQ